MTAISAELLADIDKQTVDFVENYDGTRMQPSVMPAKLPNLLVNGSSGIAVGMATNIPPHHLGEIANATIALIDDPELTNDGLCNYVNGPDFPTGATIFRRDTRRNPVTGQIEEFDAIREMYAHGRGRRRHAGDRVVRGDAPGSDGHRGHRAAVPGQQGHARREDRRPRSAEEDRGHRRPSRRVGSRRHAPGHRMQARRSAEEGAEQPLQAHGAEARLQHEHAGAGRRPAPDAAAQAGPPAPHRLAPRGRPAADGVRSRQGARSGAHPRGPRRSPSTTSTP